MEPIFAISPKNKVKIIVGWIDIVNRVATFDITEKRYFQEADCVGIDEDIFKRKSINWCKKIIFKMWDGKVYKIKKEEFMSKCYIYPPGPKEEYKANKAVFKPKLMITRENLEKMSEKEPTEEEKLKELFLRGVFG